MLWVSDPWLVTLFLEQFVVTIFRTADGSAGVFKHKVLPALTLQSLPPTPPSPPLPPQCTLTKATYLHCTDLAVYSTVKQVTELKTVAKRHHVLLHILVYAHSPTACLVSKSVLRRRENLLGSSCDLLFARRPVPKMYSFYGRSQFKRTRKYVQVRGSNPGTFKKFCFFFSFRQNVPTGSGANPAFIVVGFRGLCPTRPGNETHHSFPFNSETKNDWSHASSPPVCLGGVDSGFTL